MKPLFHEDYVAIDNEGNPVQSLDIIMHYESIIEEYNNYLKNEGYEFVRMTELSEDLQKAYLDHLNSPKPNPKQNKIPSCPHCSSIDLTFDAVGDWSMENQKIDLTVEQIYCNDCHTDSFEYKLISYEEKSMS